MKKRVLATTFALALSLSLAVPVASAADTHFTDINVKDTDALLLENPSFQIRDWDWESEEGESLIKFPAEAFSTDHVYKLPIGTSVSFTVGDDDGTFYLSAYSDPDGDGVYDSRITESIETNEDITATLLPASYSEPVTPTPTTSYMSEWPFPGHNNVSFTWTNIQDQENTKLSAAYLAKTFGPNTLIEIFYVPYAAGPDDLTCYYLLLTDEKIDPALLEGNNLSLSNAGAAVSGWAVDTINAAETANLVPDYLFGADLTQSATRSDFAGVSVKLYEAMSGQSAPDVPLMYPFEDANDTMICQAYELGFINGVGEGKFAPNDPLTREQAAVILARVYEKVHGSIPTSGSTSFADDASISSWSKDAVAFMSGKGIVGGVGNNRFDPQGNTTGEQALAIALRMFQNLK